MTKGFDTTQNTATLASAIKEAGFDFVGRYYNIRNKEKNLTAQEAKALCAAGLRIVAVWENGLPVNHEYFNYLRGHFDAVHAVQYARFVIQQPALTPIYFAVDYDASEADLEGVEENPGCIELYFKGIRDGMNCMGNGTAPYAIGVYGSGLVCEKLKQKGYVAYNWLAGSMGWRGSRQAAELRNTNMIQSVPETIILGNRESISVDKNESNAGNEGSFVIPVPVITN